MDIRQLGYFVEVADQGTVTAAARSLHMSQPPLSMQIQQLERELGCQLFERSARQMRLTDAGKALYVRAQSILELCASTRDEMERIGSGGGGVIRLGVASSVAQNLLPRWLSCFLGIHDGMRIEIREADTFQLLEKVRQGEVDLAIVRTPFSAPDLASVSLDDESLCAMGDSCYFPTLPEDEQEISLAALSKAPLVIYRRWEQLLDAAFKRKGIQLHPLCVCDDARTAARLAEGGMGVAIVPRSAVPDGTGQRVFSIDGVDTKSTICIVSRKDEGLQQQALVRDFISCMQEG